MALDPIARPTGSPTPAAGRTAATPPDAALADWPSRLAHDDPRLSNAASEELRRFLRASLGKSFAGEHNVSDADLDDFTQEAILRILGALGTFRGDSRFTTWALSIAIRTAFSQLRRRRHKHVSLEDLKTPMDMVQWPRSPADPGRGAQRAELMAALRSAIDDRLTERQRTVILAELQGVASERVATLLGTNRNAVYKVYHDARRKLRLALSDGGFGVDDIRDLWEDRR
jgi:RNA polymerase sigma-70 factor (ECF subfamily)